MKRRTRKATEPYAQPQPAAQTSAPPRWKPKLRITRLETILVQPRWLFLKVHTDEGIIGLGEPLLEGRAKTCIAAVQEIEHYLIGQDPRHVMHHWQAIYRHAFYRGDALLTSALSGVEQALWDIKGKLLNVPVHELLGGPTRDRVRVYAHAINNPQILKQKQKQGFTAFKTVIKNAAQAGSFSSHRFIDAAVKDFAVLRQAGGNGIDIAIDFHGAVNPASAKLLIKELSPLRPMFIEEPVNCQNVDVLADIAHSTEIPIAAGERIITKWGFRQLLEKRAAAILQPDLCHAGGIMEARLIAGMAEAYYVNLAPHNPLGPIALACGLQLAAAIPNFLCQEQVSLGQGYLKAPFKIEDGYVNIPAGPGLGIELDEDALKDKIGHVWKNPQAFDPNDGSVVDW